VAQQRYSGSAATYSEAVEGDSWPGEKGQLYLCCVRSVTASWLPALDRPRAAAAAAALLVQYQ
jgi:hypothetical protein